MSGRLPLRFRRTSGFAVALLTVSAIATAAGPVGVAVGRERPYRAAPLRDVGPLMGMHQSESSYTVVSYDIDHDGWTDAFIGHHGAHPAELYRNDNDGTRSLGLTPIASFYDTIHQRNDRHGCTIADVNLDGFEDIFCAKGAQNGTAMKWNELWIQGPSGTWTDEANAYGVEDIWGRGRFPRFLDLNHDAYPDLFLGNDVPRKDRHSTPNRTFVARDDGTRYEQVHLGITAEVGDTCTDVADYDHNGWEDLLVCGRYRLWLYQRYPSRFRPANEKARLPKVKATSAMFATIDDDRRPDIVYITRQSLTVKLQRGDHSFGRTIFKHPLSRGHGLTDGDYDGDGDQDIYVVQGCHHRHNQDDWLLENTRHGRKFVIRRVPSVRQGCGDTAATLDFDHDGMDDFIVLNGGGKDQPLNKDGPDQLLTAGDWTLP